MKIAIMQPTFCPWIGYFVMIARVDAFVFLDCVQFERRCWQSRNKIKLGNSEHFISLHLQKAPRSELIQNMRLNDEVAWKNTLLKTLHHAYGKTPNFKEIYDILAYALFHFRRLSELNIFLIEHFAKMLQIKTPFIKASSLDLPLAKREKLLLEICKNVKADEYLSPEGSRTYLDKNEAKALFEDSKIAVEYFAMNHPVYHQQGRGFVEYLSVIDLLCNTTNAAQILTQTAFVTGGGGVTFFLAFWLKGANSHFLYFCVLLSFIDISHFIFTYNLT